MAQLPDEQVGHIAQAAELITQADSLVITVGAGMGVDSGLPDFRGAEGFWNAYPALRRSGLNFHEIASPAAFEATPELAWGFYGHRLALYRTTRPHRGFAHLRHWGEQKRKGYFVFTSNVDGQFQKAGFNPARIHECHGSIHHLQCAECCSPDIWSANAFVPDVDAAHCRLHNALPRCPKCDAIARPNILMFDDSDWQSWRSDSQEIRQQEWLASIVRPVVIELGAGAAIPSVRKFGKAICQRFGAALIRINTEECESDQPWVVPIRMGAAAALAALAERLGE